MTENNLKDIRRNKGWDRNYIPDLLGINRNGYYNYEAQKHNPPGGRAMEIANILEAPLDKVFPAVAVKVATAKDSPMQKLRVEMGLIQKDIRVQLDIKASQYSLYDSGKKYPRDEDAKKICDFFGKTREELFPGWEIEMKRRKDNQNRTKQAGRKERGLILTTEERKNLEQLNEATIVYRSNSLASREGKGFFPMISVDYETGEVWTSGKYWALREAN